MFRVQAILRKKKSFHLVDYFACTKWSNMRSFLHEILVHLAVKPFDWHFSKTIEFWAKLFHILSQLVKVHKCAKYEENRRDGL